MSSLVCAVADNASAHRLEQSSSEVMRLEEKLRMAEGMESDRGLRAELDKTNVVVASLLADFNSVKVRQTSVDNLEVKLMARIEDLKAMVEVRQLNEQQLVYACTSKIK